MTHTHVKIVHTGGDEVARLQAELTDAREKLRQEEAALAEEQAAVNAFRMHCRLRLDDLVEEVLELRSQKQSLLTHLELLRQADELGIAYNADDPFWQGTEAEPEADPQLFDEDEISIPDLLTSNAQDRAAEKRLYRELARRFHPDMAETALQRSYSTTMMAAINNAYAAHDLNALRDLAGELDPEAAAELSQNSGSREVRKLRKQLMRCNRRRRKLFHQLKALRAENTAKLWRKAQHLEGSDTNWWDEIRVRLEEEVVRSRSEIAEIQTAVTTLEDQQPTTSE